MRYTVCAPLLYRKHGKSYYAAQHDVCMYEQLNVCVHDKVINIFEDFGNRQTALSRIFVEIKRRIQRRMKERQIIFPGSSIIWRLHHAVSRI